MRVRGESENGKQRGGGGVGEGVQDGLWKGKGSNLDERDKSADSETVFKAK